MKLCELSGAKKELNSPRSNTESHGVLLSSSHTMSSRAFVIQNGAKRSEEGLLRTCPKNLGDIKQWKIDVDVHEILPPYGRLNDKM